MKKTISVITALLIVVLIMPAFVKAQSSEIIIPDGRLLLGRSSDVIVIVREFGTGRLVGNAEVVMVGCGINMHKYTNDKGEVTFLVTPTETGKIKVTATYDGMMGTETEIRVYPDRSPPTMGIDPQVTPTNKKQLTVTGTTSPGAEVYVNQVKAVVDKVGRFSATIALHEGKNIIIVKASNDYATTTEQFEVELDTQSPTMFLETKVEEEHYVDVETVMIRGRVEPGSEVNVNGVKATVVNDIFVAEIPVTLGNNKLVIEAVDRVGNKSTLDKEFDVWTRTVVKIQIGSDTAYINDEVTKLDTPAAIVDGRTLVPLRFIGEAFGAEVEWIDESKTVNITLDKDTISLQIGSTTAVVNGAIQTLDVPPQIVNGRTMLPFRFLGEALNCEIEWDATTKTVTMIKEVLK
ncbi:MAG: stalk domain-containing protein [Caldisericia bacterium]